MIKKEEVWIVRKMEKKNWYTKLEKIANKKTIKKTLTTMNNDTYLVVAEITSLTMHVTRFGTDADKGLSP